MSWCGLVSPLVDDCVVRLVLAPMPRDNVPSAAKLREIAQAAAAAAGAQPVDVLVGAYVGDWTHELFRELLER